MLTELDFCNDGQAHQWRRPPSVDREDGMICGGCGVSEAELDHLIRQQQRRVGITEGTIHRTIKGSAVEVEAANAATDQSPINPHDLA